MWCMMSLHPLFEKLDFKWYVNNFTWSFHLHNKLFVTMIFSKYKVHNLIDVVITYHTHVDLLLLTISTLSFGVSEVMNKQRKKIT
jgi:hypothetical protein